MAFSGDHKTKQLKLLLPVSCTELRIPDELVQQIDSSEACIFGPCDRVWIVEVVQDDDGAFFRNGWPEFFAASGAGEWWILAIRHHGDGVLTVKAFDASGCLRELGSPHSAGTACTLTSHPKPQYISTRPKDFMDKMLIPANFVKQHIRKEHQENNRAEIIGPSGKACHCDLVMNQPHVFFADGWSYFRAQHDITEANILVVKYEGGNTFRVKVYEPNGFLKQYINEHTRKERDMVEVQKASMTCFKKASVWSNTYYELGSTPLIQKEINHNTMKRELSLSKHFCNAIGLHGPSNITIKTSVNSTESWVVHGHPGKNNGYLLRSGWRSFCRENGLKEGDTCAFSIIQNTL